MMRVLRSDPESPAKNAVSVSVVTRPR
jgi:hypothetical protein